MGNAVDAAGVTAAAGVVRAIDEGSVLLFGEVNKVCRAVAARYKMGDGEAAAKLADDARCTIESARSSIWLSRVRGLAVSLIDPEPAAEQRKDGAE